MYNSALLEPEVQKFIKTFNGDISKLAFAGSPFNDVSVQELIVQIEGRKKTAKKLPIWSETRNILYPPKLNLEQTSSEITAQYKAQIVDGNTLADITGGYGVDSFFFSEKFKSVDHFEINKGLSEMAKHNSLILGKDNIQFFQDDGILGIQEKKYDVIYADPSRRHQNKGKVFYLRDCEPNIVINLSTIFEYCHLFMIKTSPMLDISIGITELRNVSEIHIVAIDNEVKELLWILKEGSTDKISIKTINFNKSESEKFNFTWEEIGNAEYGLPKKYLYEPNAAILKSGAFDLISEKFNLLKLHKNTHLYTAENLIPFPGRRFSIEQLVPYNKAEMRKILTFKKANISTRNFPESVETLRKKWKIADGGDVYLFFITVDMGKQVLICSKI